MGRGSKLTLVLLALIAVIIIIQQLGYGKEQKWRNCKESLVTQMFSGDCTPTRASQARNALNSDPYRAFPGFRPAMFNPLWRRADYVSLVRPML